MIKTEEQRDEPEMCVAEAIQEIATDMQQMAQVLMYMASGICAKTCGDDCGDDNV